MTPSDRDDAVTASQPGGDETGLWSKSRTALAGVLRFSKRHRKLFVGGSIAAIVVVAARLALPWPLRAIAELVADASGAGTAALPTNALLQQSALFLCFIGLLGLFDYLARLLFSRFSIATTRDLRQAAFSATLGADNVNHKSAAGDLVSRLIGDAARVKAGMQGFLLHVATNGLLFAGVAVILFTVDRRMGLLFAAAALATGVITVWGAYIIFAKSLKHRRKEGQLANRIHNSLRKVGATSKLKQINKSSGRYEASLTRVQGRVTWAAHIIFGLAVVGCLWVGIDGVANGSLGSGEVLLFMLYALMLRGPVVRLCRQGTRTGKILGPAYRLVQMLDHSPAPAGTGPLLRLRSLKKAIALKGVCFSGSDTPDGSDLGPIDLQLNRGERVALVDDSGASLAPLAELLAGLRPTEAGTMSWDTIPIKARNTAALHPQVALIRVADGTDSSLDGLADRFRQLSIEARRRASVRVYLEPDSRLDTRDAATVLASLAADADGVAPTTIVATRSDVGLDAFDRVVHVRAGRVVYDGHPRGWRGFTAEVTTLKHHPATATGDRKFEILFAGYAPVHFLCFEPLYRRLLERDDVRITLSGGIRSGDKANLKYDAQALYESFDVPPDAIKTVEQIREMDFDLQFSSHTSLIPPRSATRRIQIFHGVSFRNKAVRPENMAYDHYFIVGPYMLSRFEDAGLMQKGDPRIAEIGFMKTDALLDGSLDRDEILARSGFDGRRPVLLYAPTGAKHNSLETVGEDAIRALLEADQYDLIVKPHDHPKNADTDWATYLRRYESEHCRIASPRENVIPLMFVADLLISDASSVVNEYALLDRPIVFLDTPTLLKQARNARHSMLDLDTFGRNGGLVADGPGDVAARVAESLADPGRCSAARKDIANNLFFNRGCATKAALAWLETHVLPAANPTLERQHVSTNY